MSLALLHHHCSGELNVAGPALSEMEDQKPESNISSPPPPSALTTTTAATAPPSWLLATLADIEERVKLLSINKPEENTDAGETFAKRAESYYEKRPQLLSLLQDLYKAYVTLSDRYLQTLTKKNKPWQCHSRHSSQVSTLTDTDEQYHDIAKETLDFSSDAESSISYQPPLTNSISNGIFDIDGLVAEVVMKNVECEILVHESQATVGRFQDSARKIELQRSLLEVLESERMILLNENARLGYRVAALANENRDLVSECVFVKREASELARCLLRMREDQRMFGLARKIEDLQGQVCKLEVRNKVNYEQLQKKGTVGDKVKRTSSVKCDEKSSKVFGWLGRVKKMDLFMCGINSNPFNQKNSNP